jgi:hypothetical protein
MYTNTSKRKDFFQNAFTEYSDKPCQVLIAVAFFTEPEPVLKLAAAGCRVKLIVRLGFPTNPAALRKVLGVEGVQVKYINNRTFHPKLYIFSERAAIVGSSNLTHSALLTNQEVNVSISVEDPRYDDLVATFVDYWSQVRVLDRTVLDAYEKLFRKYQAVQRDLGPIDSAIEALASTRIDNIGRGDRDVDVADEFLESYRATYLGFLDAFRTVERLYQADGRRRASEETIPLRLEIDSFLSWVRDHHTTGDSYLQAPLLQGPALEAKLRATISEWHQTPYRWFDEQVVPERYPRIVRTLGTLTKVNSASYDELLSGIDVAHSFHERLRFFKGGHLTHVADFTAANSVDSVRRTLSYLFFGGDEYVVRMGRCIFDPKYKLAGFGRSVVQELLGWINSDNVPICNSRTLRSLRWLGFDVALVNG